MGGGITLLGVLFLGTLPLTDLMLEIQKIIIKRRTGFTKWSSRFLIYTEYMFDLKENLPIAAFAFLALLEIIKSSLGSLIFKTLF